MSPSLSEHRSQKQRQLTESTIDVLIIGGGITGSGIARDAAMRGLRTAVIDQHDFAFGTSSRSSRLLHGGLRYLEQGRIGLVREASHEKKIVQRIAPHLTRPLGFVFPSYYETGRPLWQLKIGVKFYDLLCGRNFAPSSGLPVSETLAALPGLKPDGLRGAVRYFDALTNDARLVLDTLRSAANHGAVAMNYLSFQSGDRDVSGWRCTMQDQLSGETFVIRTRAVVNATGPWAQAIPHSSVKLRLSKGIHLVFDRTRLPVGEAAVLTEGRRILFLLPWGERTIVGTTDTDYQGAPEDVRVLPADVRYLLRTVNDAFPSVALTETDIISHWAGLRPLIASPDGSPSDISRAHEIRAPEPGWWDVAGGKLTTYRLMAEQTVDRIVQHLRIPPRECRTAREPLLPVLASGYSAIEPVAVSRAAIQHFVREEWAVTLEDIMIRRSGWHYYHKDAATIAEQISPWLADLCGWTTEEREQQLQCYSGTRTQLTDPRAAESH